MAAAAAAERVEQRALEVVARVREEVLVRVIRAARAPRACARARERVGPRRAPAGAAALVGDDAATAAAPARCCATYSHISP